MCPENPLQNGFSFLTEWFVLVPQNSDVFNKKWQSLLKPTVYYKMASPDPIFSHRMEAYTRVNPTHSVEEMARRMKKRHDMQCMPADYKIRCTTSYRYDMQSMPSDYKIRCTTSSLKLEFSTK